MAPEGEPAGYTLVEVVIAMLLVLIAVSAIMGTVITGRQSAGRTVRRAQAAQAVRRVAEALKVYRTADTSAVPGPGVGANGWGMPGDACACGAFQTGSHDLSPAIWAPELAAQGGRVSYTVTAQDTALGPQPSVDFHVTWTEP
ncbi:MAG: prepilin-type N-terminal cleavage/methylation domain-containing protein [Elusimicrobiota bacterium]